MVGVRQFTRIDERTSGNHLRNLTLATEYKRKSEYDGIDLLRVGDSPCVVSCFRKRDIIKRFAVTAVFRIIQPSSNSSAARVICAQRNVKIAISPY